MINGIFLLLGSNIGDRKWFLQRARELLSGEGIVIVKQSSYYLTPPWGKTDQPYFLNKALQVETLLGPELLMKKCLKVEGMLGRERTEKFGARTIDIDILYYNDVIITSELITIPHPRLHLRRFALSPLAEIAPDFIHPILKHSQEMLLANCEDRLPVRKVR